MSNEKRHIFLIGPSGVGKTTTAQLVGKILDRDVVDLDDAIEQRVGMGINQYFEEHGEPAFRVAERDVIRALSIESEPMVYATGGGSVLDTRNVIDMRNNGYVVYLNAFEADLIARVQADTGHPRPLLDDDLEANVRLQYLARRECYELAADITIATSRRDIETVANSVIRQCNRLSGETVDGSSSIVVGENLLEKISMYVSGYPTAVVVTQASIPEQFRSAVATSITDAGSRVIECVVPEGEEAKSFAAYENVINEMSSQHVTRSSCVIAIGGGVVGDLSGFVASTYHRGIDIIHVPTTLLAQVDSSIGGKCGINLESGKNLVGAFHRPKTIIADTAVLSTLPQEDFVSGLGEVAKYALLGNTAVSQMINDSAEKILERDPEVLVPLIRSCMNHKLHVVARDPYERNGIRATLNLGHTLAHVVETKTKYILPHGVAVALGLRYIANLSCALGRIPELQRDEAIAVCDALGLESQMPPQCTDASALVELMYSDKKSDGGLSLILMNIGGGVELVHDVDRDVVEQTLTTFIN